jgi:hypothetical protein
MLYRVGVGTWGGIMPYNNFGIEYSTNIFFTTAACAE